MSKETVPEELQQLLAEVRKVVFSSLEKDEAELAKAHPGESTSGEDKDKADKSASKPADKSPPPAKEDKAPAADASSPAPDASATAPTDATDLADTSATPPADPAADPAMGDAPPDGDPAADTGTDHAALVAEYSKLDPETKKAHYMALKEAVYADMASASAPDASAGGCPTCGSHPAPAAADPAASPPAPDMASAPPPAAAPVPPAASPDAPPVLKSEVDPEIVALKAELDAANQKLAKAETSIGKVVDFIERVAGNPERKAITSITDIQTSNVGATKRLSDLTKGEVKPYLDKLVETNLSRDDRELITLYDRNAIGVEKLAHLLPIVK